MEVKSCRRCGSKDRYSDNKCVPCAKLRAKERYHRNPERNKAIARQWKQDNRERSRVSGRKGGRTDWQPGEHEKAEARLAVTTNCDVCGSSNPRHQRGWNADHDHATGLFRGIVCHPCNIAIAHVEKFGLDRGSQVLLYIQRKL